MLVFGQMRRRIPGFRAGEVLLELFGSFPTWLVFKEHQTEANRFRASPIRFGFDFGCCCSRRRVLGGRGWSLAAGAGRWLLVVCWLFP